MFNLKNGVFLTIFSLVTSTAVWADQIVLQPSKDNTIFENQDQSNGLGDLFAGVTGIRGDFSVRRALLAFDLNSIPPGSTINNVTLSLRVVQVRITTGRNFSLHRLQQDWGEAGSGGPAAGGQGDAAEPGDATWVYSFFATTMWTQPGGDFEATASATTTVADVGTYSWSSPAMAADVQMWVDNPSANFGWLLKSGEGENQTARRFASREAAQVDRRPSLTVDFTPPELNERLYFAQFGNGNGFFSQITLINTNTTQAATAKIIIQDDFGDPFSVDLNGEPLVGGELDVMIPPSGTRVFRTDATGQIATGSVTVGSDLPLAGVIVFGGVFGLAGVSSSDETSDGFTAPVETLTSPSINTGLAVQNLEDEQVTLILELLDEDGVVLATASLNIPAMGHRARFVPDLAWDTPVDFSDFIGTIRVTTTGSVAATMIQQRVFDGTFQFATLPVVTM